MNAAYLQSGCTRRRSSPEPLVAIDASASLGGASSRVSSTSSARPDVAQKGASPSSSRKDEPSIASGAMADAADFDTCKLGA